MNNNVLFDLGEKWGLVLPLFVLENIVHIEVVEKEKTGLNWLSFFRKKEPAKNKLRITAVVGNDDEADKEITYTSQYEFTKEELEKEKNKFLSFSNALISKKDIEKTLRGMADYLGRKVDLSDMKNSTLDFGYIGKKIADANGIPYFRVLMSFDPVSKDVVVEEFYNDEFFEQEFPFEMSKLAGYLPNRDKSVIYAYETLKQIADPILAQIVPETSSESDPDNVPSLSETGIPTKNVDIATETSMKSLAIAKSTK